jgi:hypothetical protein
LKKRCQKGFKSLYGRYNPNPIQSINPSNDPPALTRHNFKFAQHKTQNTSTTDNNIEHFLNFTLQHHHTSQWKIAIQRKEEAVVDQIERACYLQIGSHYAKLGLRM